MKLPECRWRREFGESFLCAQPRVRSGDGVVTAAICSNCAYAETASRVGFADSGDAAAPSLLPTREGRATVAGRVIDWAVGVTTAPRRVPTLHRCLHSLSGAGWNNPRIFAEPGVTLANGFTGLPLSRRDVRLGAFPNWYLGLTELFLRQPRAGAYLMCQDDATFASGAREYLEQCLWPRPESGVVSLYTPSHWSGSKSFGFQEQRGGWESFGALAYVFPNPAVRRLLSDPLFLNHRHHGVAHGLQNIDSVVGAWCDLAGLSYHNHTPSLVQHIGETSTIWHNASATGRRCAADFVEEVPHAWKREAEAPR